MRDAPRMPTSAKSQTTAAAVVVAYNPDTDFPPRLKAIIRECKPVYIVDNGSSQGALKLLRTACAKHKAKLITLGKNTGIAHAQNVGLTLAFEKGADAVVLFDHDSTPQAGFTARMRQAVAKVGVNAIIGAQVFDVNKRMYSKFPVYRGLFFRRLPCAPSTILPDAIFAIASGTLITRAVYEHVGGMRADYFIDYVDWEYCLRARHRYGIATVINGAALLHHARGERVGRRFCGMAFYPPGYSPMRYGYIFRNRARLLREYFFRDRAFVAFELLSLVRDTLLLFLEPQRFKKIATACGSWFRGLC